MMSDAGREVRSNIILSVTLLGHRRRVMARRVFVSQELHFFFKFEKMNAATTKKKLTFDERLFDNYIDRENSEQVESQNEGNIEPYLRNNIV